METSGRDDYTRICAEVGLACETCTAGSARQLAALCKGLRGKAIGQLFVQIHPHSACAPMHAHFTASYKAASYEQETAPNPVPQTAPRKGVVPERLRAIAAVA